MPSQQYTAALKNIVAHHQRQGTFTGKFLRPHKPWLVEVARKYGCDSGLDYGCGKGDQYRWRDPDDGLTIEDALGFPVEKYDPGVLAYANEPKGRFDLVICTHVLGSVPVVDLPWFLARLFSHARLVVYVAERLGDVKKDVIPNREAHPIGWSHDQWAATLATYKPAGVSVVLKTRTRTADFGTVWTTKEIA